MNMNLWDMQETEEEEVEETQARLNASQNVVSDLKSSNWVRLISVQRFVLSPRLDGFAIKHLGWCLSLLEHRYS